MTEQFLKIENVRTGSAFRENIKFDGKKLSIYDFYLKGRPSAR